MNPITAFAQSYDEYIEFSARQLLQFVVRISEVTGDDLKSHWSKHFKEAFYQILRASMHHNLIVAMPKKSHNVDWVCCLANDDSFSVLPDSEFALLLAKKIQHFMNKRLVSENETLNFILTVAAQKGYDSGLIEARLNTQNKIACIKLIQDIVNNYSYDDIAFVR